MTTPGEDRTYTVSWHRPDGEAFTCQGLTPRIAFARLWAAWKESGEITVTNVSPDWLTDKEIVTEDWPYPIPGPECEDARGDQFWTCVTHDSTGLWCNACTQWREDNEALLVAS